MLTNAQKNAVSELQALAYDTVRIKYRMISLVQIYINESINSVTTPDLQAIPDFAHMTAAELQAAGAALAAVNTTLGDFSAASNVAALLKIVTTTPK